MEFKVKTVKRVDGIQEAVYLIAILKWSAF